MYSLRRLAAVARDGLTDLGPAIGRAFNADPDDDRMELVYGARPRRTVVLLSIGCVAAGEVFGHLGPELPVGGLVHWPAVFVALVFGTAIRRYLFRGGHAGPEDFPWLAGSVAPAFVLTILVAPLAVALFGPSRGGAAPFTGGPGGEDGGILVLLTDAVGLAAALTIAVATLCFRKDWIRALIDLAVRLFVFRLMVWVTALVMLEINIVSTIIGAITGWHLPEWVADLADEIGYAAILLTAYLAIIGGTWMVCKKSFAELLESGQVDVLAAVEKLGKRPGRKKRARRRGHRKKHAGRHSGKDAD